LPVLFLALPVFESLTSKLKAMKKVLFYVVVLSSLILFSSYIPASITYNGDQYIFNYEDIHFTDGDFSETPFVAINQRTGEDPGVVFCPGTGTRCTVIMVINGDTYVFAGKKGLGISDYVII